MLLGMLTGETVGETEFNDDRLGRLLDRLGKAETWRAIVRQGQAWTERVVIYRSDGLAKRDGARFDEDIRAATDAYLALAPEVGPGRRQITSEKAFADAMARIDKKHAVGDLLWVKWRREAYPSREDPGRQRWVVSEVIPHADKIEARRQRLGWQTLITNPPTDQLPTADVVLAYNDGWLIENQFRDLKNRPLGIRPLFVTNDAQFAGLTHLILLALRIMTLIISRGRCLLTPAGRARILPPPRSASRMEPMPTATHPQPAARPPPSGTVTFLFTDIEGSTRLWDRHGDEMGRALRQHDDILHEAIAALGGHVFKTVGDAFCAAFGDAPSAVAAALTVQIGLKQADWVPPGPLHVRMALHTGRAEERDGDYFGRPLNRCARIESLAHGGQVLLSEDTAALLTDRLPPEAGIEDLGSHRLRDLTRPERIFLLRHPELPASYPPLRSLDARPNNLPVRRSSFVGRARELADVKERLGRSRLVTLKGVGGLGKTSLALQAAADLLDEFGDGLWFVDLAQLADPALVVQTAAAVLGVREETDQPLITSLTERLRDRSLLLILDNCEHLIAACAALAHQVLRHCPEVRILATSREALNVEGEDVWRLPPLALPGAPARRAALGGSGTGVVGTGVVAAVGVRKDRGAYATAESRTDPLSDLLQSEAVSLFVERAQQASPSFTLTTKNAPAVAEICRRLDGIALAIELAAARVPMLAPEKIAARLDESLRLLSKGTRSARKHQETLRAAIDWSYDLCAAEERRLLARLAVFHGGWSLEAAQVICADDALDEWDILDLLTQLTDRSLVEIDASVAEHPRQYLLETIHQYADDKLIAGGEDVPALRDRHLAWCSDLAVKGDAGLKGEEQAEWLARLEAEHDNLRAALDHAAARGCSADGLRLGGHLWRFWHMRGFVSEGRRRLNAVLACPDAADEPDAFAAALHGAGTLAMVQGDLETARQALERCLASRRSLGDTIGTANTLNNLAMLANKAGDNVAARRILEEKLEIARELGDAWTLVTTLGNLAVADRQQGAFDMSRARLEESLPIWRALGDRRWEANTLMHLAEIDQVVCDNIQAIERYRASLAIREALGDSTEVSSIMCSLGRILHGEGDIDAARSMLMQALEVADEREGRDDAARTLIEIGRLERYAGNVDAAEAAFRESAELLDGIDNPFVRSTLHNAVGRLACDRQDLATARRLLEQALSSRHQMRIRPWVVSALESHAILAMAEGRSARAITLAVAAAEERARLGMPLESFDARELGATLDRATEALSAPEVEAARATGRAMSIDAAVELVMDRAEPTSLAGD